jgi:4a-hydroxytetrahydrobiopterin dehydratase
MAKLTLEQVKFNLGKVPGWQLAEDQISLHRTFVCADFLSAVRLINRVTEQLEQDSDHVEMRIHRNKVTFRLTTLEAKGLTGKDFALAQLISKLA